MPIWIASSIFSIPFSTSESCFLSSGSSQLDSLCVSNASVEYYIDNDKQRIYLSKEDMDSIERQALSSAECENTYQVYQSKATREIFTNTRNSLVLAKTGKEVFVSRYNVNFSENIPQGNKVEESLDSIGYMLQKDCLLEWRTVLSNTLLGLEVKGKKTKENNNKTVKIQCVETGEIYQSYSDVARAMNCFSGSIAWVVDKDKTYRWL